MKKLVFIIVLLSSLISIAACTPQKQTLYNLEQDDILENIYGTPLEVIDASELKISEYPVNILNIKKESLISIKKNPFNYCDRRRGNENCVCPERYVKLKESSGFYSCIPRICLYIFGSHFIDNAGHADALACKVAVRKEVVEECGSVSYQQGKEICYLSYVSVTNDTSVCAKIEDQHLKDECYR